HLGLFPYDRLTAIPPAGSCLSYSFSGGFDQFYETASGEPLDAGVQIRSQGPGGTARWSRSPLAALDYYKMLGGETSATGFLRMLLGPYLAPGAYRIFGGGADVPEFEMEARVPEELVWSNRAEIGVIDRAADLEIAWAAPDAETSSVLIVGGAHDSAHDASYLFVCAADPAARRFAIPRRTLAAAPASRAEPG